MTQAQFIDSDRDLVERFTGHFTIRSTHVSGFPGAGTPVTIETDGSGARITVGTPHERKRLILSGSFDARAGALKGTYDDWHAFELSLGEGSPRRIRCSIGPSRPGGPGSSTWEADEDGPP